jgi:hypothetical protein
MLPKEIKLPQCEPAPLLPEMSRTRQFIKGLLPWRKATCKICGWRGLKHRMCWSPYGYFCNFVVMDAWLISRGLFIPWPAPEPIKELAVEIECQTK